MSPKRDDDYDLDRIATVKTDRMPMPPPAHAVRIEVVKGPDAGATARVARRVSTLGRSPAADFRLSDATVSSFHVEIGAVQGGLSVRDLESANGTIYAGARIERCIVPSGSMLNLGHSVVRIDADVPFAADVHELPTFGGLHGGSVAMRELFSILARLAPTELSVLIEGPTGTGKELVARALHDKGRSAQGPFVVLDCTAIPASLAESTLFGHEKGAFTGATDRRVGVFEAAEGGTVFLDEVGELPLDLQPKLLRVLERREVVRVGSNKPKPIQVRVIGATWRDPRAMINQGTFREDLYYRLAQARVSIPPLREHLDDVPILVQHFLRRLPTDAPGARAISPDALEDLKRRDWPGNVRELRSTVERAAATAASDVITPTDLAFERMLAGHHTAPRVDAGATIPPDAPLTPFKEAKRTLIDEFERDYLARLLSRTGNNLSRAAAVAGVERHHLRDLLRKHGLRGDDDR